MRRLLHVAAAAALLLAGCGGEPGTGAAPTDPAATPGPAQVSPEGPASASLEDVAGLGLEGTVTLAAAAGRTEVGVELEGAEGAAFSAAIRDGSCGATGEVAYDLGVVEGGSTSLVAEAPLGELLAQSRAFVLTAAEADGLVACADFSPAGD